jgi:hypothetical protein
MIQALIKTYNIGHMTYYVGHYISIRGKNQVVKGRTAWLLYP